MFFVAGITGHVGGAAARRLLDQGKAIRALVLDPQKVLGKQVRARAIPRAQWTAVLTSMGFPPEKASPWEEMQDGFNSGWIDFGVPGTEFVPGTTTPAQVFARARQG